MSKFATVILLQREYVIRVTCFGRCQSHHWNRLAHGVVKAVWQNGSWQITTRAHTIWLILHFLFQISQIETSASCLEPCFLWSFWLASEWPWVSFLGKQCHSVKILDILNQDHIDNGATKARTTIRSSFKLCTFWVAFWFRWKWSTLQGCQTQLSFHHLGLPRRCSVVIFHEDLSVNGSYGDSKHYFRLIGYSSIVTSYFNRRWFQDILRVCIWYQNDTRRYSIFLCCRNVETTHDSLQCKDVMCHFGSPCISCKHRKLYWLQIPDSTSFL